MDLGVSVHFLFQRRKAITISTLIFLCLSLPPLYVEFREEPDWENDETGEGRGDEGVGAEKGGRGEDLTDWTREEETWSGKRFQEKEKCKE